MLQRQVGSELAAWFAYACPEVMSEEMCDWLKDLYPCQICVCGNSHAEHSSTEGCKATAKTTCSF